MGQKLGVFRRHRRLRALAVAGLTGACFLGAVPALADQSVMTQGGFTYNPFFSPSTITINPGETVTFTNADGGTHNLAWDDGKVAPNPPSPSPSWPPNVSRSFPTPGRYRFYCQMHGGKNGFGMSGIVLVRNADGTIPPPPDTTPPSLGKVTASPGKKRVTLTFSSSEKGTASGTINRKNSKGKFKKFGGVSFSAKKSSSNSITIKKTSAGTGLTTGTFSISFRVKDAAGNSSSKKTVSFVITR
jgi:plastocyanin